MRIRPALVMFLSMAIAQSPWVAPASPTPNSGDCGRVGEYLQRLRSVHAEAMKRWAELFSGYPYDAALTTKEEWRAFLMSRSSHELIQVADFMDWRVTRFKAVDVPALFATFHRERVDGLQVVANMVRDAAARGIPSAVRSYSPAAKVLNARVDAETQVILPQCPEFAIVLNYKPGNADGIPEAG